MVGLKRLGRKLRGSGGFSHLHPGFAPRAHFAVAAARLARSHFTQLISPQDPLLGCDTDSEGLGQDRSGVIYCIRAARECERKGQLLVGAKQVCAEALGRDVGMYVVGMTESLPPASLLPPPPRHGTPRTTSHSRSCV